MSNRSRTVVIDPGHGGPGDTGASSSNHAIGPNGLLEKDLTLDLARRVRGLLVGSAQVILTRDAAVNLSLSERAAQARRNNAELFVSLHWNGDRDPDVDGTESWVARQASPRSRRFARRLVDRLASVTGARNRGVRERDLGVLLLSRHAPDTGACLVEVGFLSNPGQARRLESDGYREELARAVAECIREDLDAGAAASASGVNRRSAARLLSEAGVALDENPHAGLAGGFDAPKSPQPPLVIRLEKVKIGSTELTLSPDGRGQFEGFIHQPPIAPGYEGYGPISLKLAVTGRLIVEVSPTSQRVYDVGKDAKTWPLAGALASAVVDTSGGVSHSDRIESKVASDGTFTASASVGAKFVRKLTITAVIERKGEKSIRRTAVVELIDLEGFLKLVNAYESARPKTQSHFQFLASLRKVYQGGPQDPLEPLFQQTLYRNRSVQALAVPGTGDYTKLSRYTVLYVEGTAVHVDGEYVDVGHVLTGIEGAPKQKPDYDDILGPQNVPKPSRPDLVVTWEGDLASALQSYILDYPAALSKSQAIDVTDYLRRKAGDADLLGDIDGVNLGASYDATKSLADNLKPYYSKLSRRRFHEFMKNSTKDLPLKPGTKLLSDQARKNIADHVNNFLTAAFVLGKFNSVDQNLVHDMIQPGSPEMDLVVDYFVRFLQDGLALEARAGVTIETLGVLGTGDGPPFAKAAIDDCWARCGELLRNAALASNPNQKSAATLLAETGVKMDPNPYFGLTEKKLDAVIRAAFESHQMPEALLALWAKEGSTRMETGAREIPQATNAANAKSIFRSGEYYIALGTDHFIDTTRPSPTGDNMWDSSDAAAPAHEKHFVSQVQALVKSRALSHDISAAINAELTVATNAAGKFTIQPSVKFYALSLLLADAFFTELLGMSYPELSSIPVALNYLHWNMSEASFRAFLKSAEIHRKEPAHSVGGQAISIEQWALHTKPSPKEFFQPRANAIRFLHYINSYRPIFAASITRIKPGIEDLPRIPANVAETGALSNVPVIYAGGRAHTAVSDPSLFQCAPDPLAVTAATLLPNPSTTADADLRDALTALGATAAEVRTFESGGGLVPLRPIAEAFGGAAVQELMRRLRYTKRQILSTPHTYGRDVAQKLGVRSAVEILAPRLLLTIPGHFRELARHTTDEKEAFALENFGWLFMRSMRDDVRQRTNKNWWVPPPPVFVTPFSSTLPALSAGVQRMILRSLLIDSTLSVADYNARFNNWKNGLAGRQWRMETGVDPASPAPGRPFYPELVTVPASVNIAAQKTQIDRAWQRRLADTDAQFPPNSAQSTAALIECGNDRLTNLGLTAIASLGGLELVYHYPKLEPAKPFTSLPVLTVIKPTFEQFCSTVFELGWNDLLFQTQGAFCFRGTKISGSAAAARRISNHGYAIAYDVMNHENDQGQNHATTDPRIVALFETFRFQWGRCFPTPDPMHFDYHG